MYHDDRPHIIAHRGASANAPENTIAAFKQAVLERADCIEMDVLRCKTGEVVVMHDDTVNRTTHGAGNVQELSLSALKKLDAGIKFSPRFKHERIPTLNEVFEELSGEISFNVEIKSSAFMTDGIEKAVVTLIESFNLLQDVVISSFNPFALARVRYFNPGIKRALLLAKDQKEQHYCRYWYPLVENPQMFNLEVTCLKPSFVRRAHRFGKAVNVWTVNAASDLLRMIELGVDGIITNHPQRLFDLLESRKNLRPNPNRF